MIRQLSSIASVTNIVDDPQGPVWTHGSPSQIWRWKDFVMGLHPIRRCQGDL